MATIAGGQMTARGRVAGRAVLVSAVLWTVAGVGKMPRAAEARPRTADAAPSLQGPSAHLGGGFSGLAVDGDAVYIGAGSDVLALRTDGEGQSWVVLSVPLPDPVTSLAIAPEVDRLYAAAGDTVYALSIADRRRPTVIAAAFVPMAAESNIVARGDTVYARVDLVDPGKARCVAAVTFGAATTRADVGSAGCATDLPVDAWPLEDQLTLGDGVLAVYSAHDWDDGVPPIALFDVRDASRPRFTRSMAVEAFEYGVQDVLMAGKRLWMVDTEGTVVQSFDVSDPDAEPVRMVNSPAQGFIERMFLAEGEVWLVDNSFNAYDPNTTGPLQPTKRRWIYGCSTDSAPHGWVAATRSALLTLSHGSLLLCRMPSDEAHFSTEPTSWLNSEGAIGQVAAGGGRAFVAAGSASWLTLIAYPWPNALLRAGWFRVPPIVDGNSTRWVGAAAFDADARHVVVADSAERVLAFRMPVSGSPMADATWDLAPVDDRLSASTRVVKVAADRAVVLRESDLHVLDLSRPDAPAARIADRWRSGHALAVGAEWAAVLAGGYVSGADHGWSAPHVVIVDMRKAPPTVLGELTLASRQGWAPIGIARIGDRLVVALNRSSGASAGPPRDLAEVVVIDAADPAMPAVAGRVAIDGEAAVRLGAIAGAGSLAIVGGTVQPAAEGDAPPDWRKPRYRGRLWLVDVTAPEQPVVRESLAVPGSPSDIAVDGRAVLVAAMQGGLQRFDLALPGDVPGRVWRLMLPWLAPGEREVQGQLIPIHPSTAPWRR